VVVELSVVCRLAFSDLAEVSDSLLFDAELLVSDAVWELLAVSASVLELALVELLADAGPVVERLLVPLPAVDEVAPPPEALLVCDEVPFDTELPKRLLEAVAPVELEDDVSLLVLDLFDDEFSVSLADFTLLEFSVWFADAASVASNDLL
jgi:hypothetical protein